MMTHFAHCVAIGYAKKQKKIGRTVALICTVVDRGTTICYIVFAFGEKVNLHFLIVRAICDRLPL